MTCHTFGVTIEDRPNAADVEYLKDRLHEFNADVTGYHDGSEIAIFDRDAAGRIVAGIYGWSWGGLAEIDTLWIADELRHAGRGSSMIAEFEAEAIRRRCARILVGTHSFQAPGFYQRLGYEVVAEVPDKPIGYQHYDLVKTFEP